MAAWKAAGGRESCKRPTPLTPADQSFSVTGLNLTTGPGRTANLRVSALASLVGPRRRNAQASVCSGGSAWQFHGLDRVARHLPHCIARVRPRPADLRGIQRRRPGDALENQQPQRVFGQQLRQRRIPRALLPERNAAVPVQRTVQKGCARRAVLRQQHGIALGVVEFGVQIVAGMHGLHVRQAVVGAPSRRIAHLQLRQPATARQRHQPSETLGQRRRMQGKFRQGPRIRVGRQR
jgi:hypothetical protein